MEFYNLKVARIRRETPDTITIEPEIPEAAADTFAYQQGQYVTVRHMFGDREIRRSYSMSSAPFENKLAITVKKVPGGRMSTWLHDDLKEGDTLEIAPPAGRFYNDLHPEKRRSYYLFAAGSGITPIMSILKTVLENEPMSAVFLLYGNRDEQNIIFREELDRIAERYHGQFIVEYVLSKPAKESGGGIFGLFKKSTSNWQGKTGRIDARTVGLFLDENSVQGPEYDSLYYICGPGAMADSIKGALLGRGIASGQIHTEHFVNADHVPGEIPAGATGGKRAIVHLNGKRIEIEVPDGVALLDALVAAKYDPPYSCTAGACSTCMAKLLKGEVKMDACYALDDEEVKAGYILTCQSKLTTDLIEVIYE